MMASLEERDVQVLRCICAACPGVCTSHLPALVPSVAALVQSTAGPTKLAAERTLSRLLQVPNALLLSKYC